MSRRAAAIARELAPRFLAALAALGASACGGSAPASAGDRVFYAAGMQPSPGEPSQIEMALPALDRPAASPEGAAFKGVELNGGGIRFARPTTWTIRGGTGEPPARYVQYVSPRAVLVGVYERNDAPRASWAEIQSRFEAEVAAAHSVIVSGAVPVAAGNTQGRAYHLRHRVAATTAPFSNESREILLRAHDRVVLVQIVTSGALTPLADEILPFLASFDLR
jgi:hypothetical protein